MADVPTPSSQNKKAPYIKTLSSSVKKEQNLLLGLCHLGQIKKLSIRISSHSSIQKKVSTCLINLRYLYVSTQREV